MAAALDMCRMGFATAVVAGMLGCYAPMRAKPEERALLVYAEHKSSLLAVKTKMPSKLTADMAVKFAKEHSARLLSAEARVNVAEAHKGEVGAWKNPELRLQGLRLDELTGGEPRANVALRIFPPRPGENSALEAEAEAQLSEEKANARLEELADEAFVRFLFQEALLAEEEWKAAKDAADARNSLYAAVKERVALSQATKVDEALANLSSKNAEEEVLRTKGLKDVARQALLARIGADGDVEIELVGDPLDERAIPDLPGEETLVRAALEKRPEVAAAAARVDAADAALSVERTRRWPWLTFAEVGYAFGPDVTAGLGFSFRAGMELPIFDTGSNRAARAEAERNLAERQFTAEVKRIIEEVRARLREVRAARELLQNDARTMAPALEAARTASKEAFEQGQIDLVRLHVLEEQRFSANALKLKRVRAYRQALSALNAAIGGGLK